MASVNGDDLPDDVSEDFNPAQEVGSDDEGDEKPEVGGDEDAKSELSGGRRSFGRDNDDDDVNHEDDQELTANSRADGDADEDEDELAVAEEQGDEDEEDEDEEEEDDDDEDDIGQPSKKRRRRNRGGNQFIDVEAEVDEDEEEEPDEDEELPGDEMHPDDLQELPPGADRDDRKHRELDRQRDVADHIAAEQEAARLRERYGRQGRTGTADRTVLDQRALLPTPESPKIWRMKCRPGKEREIIFSVQTRLVERQDSRQPLRILSIFERGGPMAGNLYIEAWRQEDVRAAVDGISHVFMSSKELMIAVDEMPALLRTKKSKQLTPGMYVRMKRGLYQGDLAQIDDVETNGITAMVRLVPRLDYGLNDDANAPNAGLAINDPKKRKRPLTLRPAPKPFSEHEAKKKHGKFLSKITGGFRYQGKDYINGFLMQEERITNLLTENVNPTLEEVTKFAASEDGEENLDLAALAATLKSGSASDFLPGDNVEISRGEQKGISGRAVDVYGDVVRLRVDRGTLAGKTLEAPIKDLRKFFREGDHVKVVGGSKFFDEVGMVVKIRDERVTILTDSNHQEITVFSKDLRVATDSGGKASNGKYFLLDLVQLDASTVGCVVRVDRESLRVLTQNGDVRSLLPSNLGSVIDPYRHAIAIDRDGNEIKFGDTIKEVSGEQRTGRVAHLWRHFVFAQSKERTENSGIWAARHSTVQTVAAKGGRLNGQQTGVDLTKMNPVLKANAAPGGAMPPPQFKGKDRLIGKAIRIRTGPNKGLIGLVTDTTDKDATVELYARKKHAIYPKSMLTVVDAVSGAVIQLDASTYGAGRPPPGAAGPQSRAQAPMAPGGRTPGWQASGAKTSAWSGTAVAGGGRTPAWKQDSGGRTPGWSAGGGGQTAYGGGPGGQTAYGGTTSYGGATSYGGGSVWGGASGGTSSWNQNAGGGAGSGGTSAWNPNAGGRTPAHVAGGRTPAYLSNLDAPTPGFNSAPTPGAMNDHPTPGGFRDHPTPGGFRGGYAETPAPYSAPTPGGVGGDDEGPRYD